MPFVLTIISFGLQLAFFIVGLVFAFKLPVPVMCQLQQLTIVHLDFFHLTMQTPLAVIRFSAAITGIQVGPGTHLFVIGIFALLQQLAANQFLLIGTMELTFLVVTGLYIGSSSQIP